VEKKKISTWSDYHLIVEDHADHAAHAEGEEAMPFELGSDDGSDQDDDYQDDVDGDDDDDDNDSDGGSDGYAEADAEEKALFESEDDGPEDDDLFEMGDALAEAGEALSGSSGDVASGTALVACDAPPVDNVDPLLSLKLFRSKLLDQAVAQGDDATVTVMRRLLSAADKDTQGRKTSSYSELSDALMTERTVVKAAKRARMQEDRDDSIRETDAKRLLATEKKMEEEAKSKRIADAAAAILAKKESDKAAGEEKQRDRRMQTCFAAKHAAGMHAVIQGMGEGATKNAIGALRKLEKEGRFNKWVYVDDAWQPDPALYHVFGTLSDINKQFTSLAQRAARCSPQLSAFIVGYCGYTHPLNGPDPQLALTCLLRHCFLCDKSLFKDAYSPYQLLCSSHMILDLAFVRAVRVASDWLDHKEMPAGHILWWPPISED
jgi:hypothetical protein